MSNCFNQYVDYYRKYRNIYGNKVAILMQVGSFYEIYGRVADDITNLNQIADLLDLHIAKKSSHNMSGFAVNYSDKYINTLVRNQYQVVLVNQQKQWNEKGKVEITRQVEEVLSNATSFDQQQSNWLFSIYFDWYKNRETGQLMMSMGIAGLDPTVNKSFTNEYYSTIDDTNFPLDQAIRLIQFFNPVEIITASSNVDNLEKIKDSVNYLNTSQITKIPENLEYWDYSMNNYRTREKFLAKLFQVDDAHTTLLLDKHQLAAIAYAGLVSYLANHNQKLVATLTQPQVMYDSNELAASRLNLYNDSYKQLNIIQLADSDFTGIDKVTKRKIRSTLDIISMGLKTPMGHRLLKDRLLNPMVNGDQIRKHQANINTYLETYGQIKQALNGIKDLDRLIMRITSGKLPIDKMSKLIEQCTLIKSVVTTFTNVVKKDKIVSELDKFIARINYCYDQKGKLSDAYLKEEHSEMYQTIKSMEDYPIYCDRLAKHISNLLKLDHSAAKVDLDKGVISMTKSRYQKLGLAWQPCTQIENFKQLMIITSNKTQHKISTKYMQEAMHNHTDSKDRVDEFVKQVHKQLLEQLSVQYSTVLREISNQIAQLDLIQSQAELIDLYDYNFPAIKEHNPTGSFLNFKTVRNPIGERLEQNYVPHNVSLGEDYGGMLLYGNNGTGKTTIMKTIGICVVLAQAGLPIPAATESYLAPFNRILTRILGNDNLYKGISSFEAEVRELKDILVRNNQYTLVLGDEVCKGTERVSAVALNVATILHLDNQHTKFIFASHFHEVANDQRINKAGIFHLTTTINPDGSVIYNRALEQGPGDSLYGIEMAQARGLPQSVIKEAFDIREKILGIKPRPSRYNSDKEVNLCEKCGQPATETHHIVEQHKFKGKLMLNGKYIHEKANLMALCENCHKQMH